MKNYSLDDVLRTYDWLGHRTGVTELNAYHPDHKWGEEHKEWSKEHNTYPKIWYVKNQNQLLDFVNRYVDDHELWIGINERSHPFKNDLDYNRKAKGVDVSECSNIRLSFLPSYEKEPDQVAFNTFVRDKLFPHYDGLDYQHPAIAHADPQWDLLSPIIPINKAVYPDIEEQLHKLVQEHREDFGFELREMGYVLRKSGPLSERILLPGTSNPKTPDKKSYFYGGPRIPDEKLRKHLFPTMEDDTASKEEATG